MFERTERATHRYTSNFKTSLILASFATLNYVTDKDPGLTILCGTLALGFGLRGLYEMEKQGQLKIKLRKIKKNLYSFWERNTLPSPVCWRGENYTSIVSFTSVRLPSTFTRT